MNIDSKIKAIHNNYFVLNAVDYKYYNLVFTDEEIILDFVNRSFKPWIIRSGAYRTLQYENCSIDKIKTRSEENIVIKYEDICSIEFNKRTFFKNAYLKLNLTNNKEFILITKEKRPDEIDINITKNN